MSAHLTRQGINVSQGHMPKSEHNCNYTGEITGNEFRLAKCQKSYQEQGLWKLKSERALIGSEKMG